jgi:hypothetical protein
MIGTTEVGPWRDFENYVPSLKALPHPLFRGLADADWRLSTTLERADPEGKKSLRWYYGLIKSIEPQLQAFGRKTWDDPTLDPSWANSRDYRQAQTMLGSAATVGYMAHLRHHGFPSPLLATGRSPRIWRRSLHSDLQLGPSLTESRFLP